MARYQECHCFFHALGFFNEIDFYSFSPQDLKTAYKKASLACHPDKNHNDLKHIPTKAQQIINQAKDIIGNPDKCFSYLDHGEPPEEYDHDCRELESVMEFIKDQLKRDLPAQKHQRLTTTTGQQAATTTSIYLTTKTNRVTSSPPPMNPVHQKKKTKKGAGGSPPSNPKATS